MNKEDLTIKEAKEIAAMFSSCQQNESSFSSIYKGYIGKYVIVRTRNEGINAGFVKELDNTGVIISDARRIYYHRPKDTTVSWYEGVANTGLSEDSKISPPVKEKVIVENYSLTLCSDEGKESIINKKSNEQN